MIFTLFFFFLNIKFILCVLLFFAISCLFWYINISSMVYSLLYIVAFLALFNTFGISSLADDSVVVADSVVTSSVVEVDMSHMDFFYKDLKFLETTLEAKNYVDSLDILEKVRDRIQFQQNLVMSSFFPLSLEGWSLKKKESIVENELADTDYGVIFTQSYFNKQGHTIEINVVNAEELIRDYNDLFNNPGLVRGMGNTHIIDLKGYKTIETVFDDVKHYEQNIVLSNTVIMTLIAIGIDDVSILNNFIEFVDIEALDLYLN